MLPFIILLVAGIVFVILRAIGSGVSLAPSASPADPFVAGAGVNSSLSPSPVAQGSTNLLAFLGTAEATRAPRLTAGGCILVPPTIKIRPSTSSSVIALLSAARANDDAAFLLSSPKNDIVSFQVACLGPFDALSVAVNLPAPLSALAFSQSLYNASTASDCRDGEDQTGLWPDPLVPHVDPFYREERSKRKITTAAAGEIRAFWLDIFVPSTTEGGKQISGSVLAASSSRRQTLPFVVKVRSFALPDPGDEGTPAAFGFFSFFDSNNAEVTGLGGFAEQQNYARTAQQYADAALMHRVSLRSVLSTAPELLSAVSPSWTSFIASGWLSFLKGRPLPFGFTNAKLSTVELPAPLCRHFYSAPGTVPRCSAAVIASQLSYWKNVLAWFRLQGLDSKLLAYLGDEPASAIDWLEIFASSKAVLAASGSSPISMIITTSPQRLKEAYVGLGNGTAEEAMGVATVLCPIVNDLVPMDCVSPLIPNNRGAAAFLSSAGDDAAKMPQLWAYSSCEAHGCEGGCKSKRRRRRRGRELYGPRPPYGELAVAISPSSSISPSPRQARNTTAPGTGVNRVEGGASDAVESGASTVPAPVAAVAGTPVCAGKLPTLMIDHSLVTNRVLSWLLYLLDLKGELYWTTSFKQASLQYRALQAANATKGVPGGYAAAALEVAGREWEADGMFAFGGQGDGTLFYRGLPSIIGGSREIPIASLRLKAIRDGVSDLLVMKAAETKVGRAKVLAVVRKVVTSPVEWRNDPTVLADAREELEVLADGQP